MVNYFPVYPELPNIAALDITQFGPNDNLTPLDLLNKSGFNPDDYTKEGANITSCWGNNAKGICVVKKSKTKEWNERLNALRECINYWINIKNITNKTVEIIQLYYDIINPKMLKTIDEYASPYGSGWYKNDKVKEKNKFLL